MVESFNGADVYISKASFKQNIIVKHDLRKFVDINISGTSMTAIGGESYLYGLINSSITTMHAYTNSLSIYKDVELNSRNLQSTKVFNNLIDYNLVNSICYSDILVLNLANLNINLLNLLNKQCYSTIIIINCHSVNFWQRIKLLYNYKLVKRKQFTNDCYFVTVNILKLRHTIIPFGSSCAPAFNLQLLKLRDSAYPFDWSKISLTQLQSVFKNNFSNYCNVSIKKYSPNHDSYMLSNSYNVTFAHEVLISSDLPKFISSLESRVSRLLNLRKTPLVFMHINFGKKSKGLRDLIFELNKYFTKYEILYISNIPPDINTNVIFYELVDYTFIDWQFSNLDWRGILSYFLSQSSLFRPE